MPPQPSLQCLRFFDAAARHQNFVRAAEELGVTAAAVAYRVKTLEDHFGHLLFDRHSSGVTLNPRGRACLGEAQRLLADFREMIERHRGLPRMRRLKVVAIESIAERWLMPKLAGFYASWPDIAMELETDLLRVDPNRHDYDAWITYAGEVEAPSAETSRWETLFEETLFPVCSPVLLDARGRPRSSKELQSWPLLYHLGLPSDWSRWLASRGDPPPDLSHASGFRLCSLLIRAAREGMGVAIGRPALIARELREGTLVPLFDSHSQASTRCCLITTAAARRRPEVQAFREWVLEMAANERPSPAFDPAAARVQRDLHAAVALG